MNPKFSIESLGTPGVKNPLGTGVSYTTDDERIPHRPFFSSLKKSYDSGQLPEGFEIAGARELVFFDPARVNAAIVTCGGLCPGLNAVIRGLVHQLWFRYGCRNIIGIRNGYNGLGTSGAAADMKEHTLSPSLVELNPEAVRNIHQQGGTILGSSRGTPPTSVLVDRLKNLGINTLFVIGGDGTMRGATAIWQEAQSRGYELAVVGVPKTIDNDIPFVKRTFGFETAVGIATSAVLAAHTEAECAPNGIGLIKLMGRHSGYIAANAALASGHANFCLVPEVPFQLDGQQGLLAALEKRLAERDHAVIVVAEGAGQDLCANDSGETDASGNAKLGNIGEFLQSNIKKHFASKGVPVVLKYIDPSYIIRAAAANPADQLFCIRLAQAAVHAAMAGKTGMMIGYWHGQITHVPLSALAGETHRISPQGELWADVLESTGQPANLK